MRSVCFCALAESQPAYSALPLRNLGKKCSVCVCVYVYEMEFTSSKRCKRKG